MNMEPDEYDEEEDCWDYEPFDDDIYESPWPDWLDDDWWDDDTIS